MEVLILGIILWCMVCASFRLFPIGYGCIGLILVHSSTSFSFLCVRKEKKYNSPLSAINIAEDLSQDPSSSELVGLCSGNFETQPFSLRRRHPSDDSTSQGVRDLLGIPSLAKPKPVGISKLLQSRPDVGLNVQESQGSEMSEVIGLCSGVFPTAESAKANWLQPKGAGSKTQQSAGGTSDGMSGSSGNESEGENILLRWVKKQKVRSRPRESAAAAGELSDSEDEDMPVLTRRRRRVKPRPKPSKE